MITINNQNMVEFRNQLEKGMVQGAYQGLVEFISGLRTRFQKNHPEYDVPGNLYQGYMDMTYFSVIPPAMKQRRLKVAVVFLYDAFRFEVWLSGFNRQVQARYWRLLRGRDLQLYRLVDNPLKTDAIIEHTLMADPNFDDLNGLTIQIESGTLSFIAEMEEAISKLDQ